MKEENWFSPCPQGFSPSVITTTGHTSQSQEKVWAWLHRKETFTKGQIPPYRVEFVGEEDDPVFHEGSYNNHHGPFLHLPAHVTKIEPLKYREMQYLYGSYVLGYRFIRPTALKIYLEPKDNETTVVVELHAYVRPFIKGIWESLNRFFWTRFFFPYLRKID